MSVLEENLTIFSLGRESDGQDLNRFEDLLTVPTAKGLSPLRRLHHANELAVFVVSAVVNPVLAALILTERNAGLVPYARVLLQNCIVDFIYTLVCYMSEMQIEFTDGYMVFTINSPLKRLPMAYHYALLFAYSFFCSGAINIATVMFYFRYVLVCKGKTLSRLQFASVSAVALSGSFLAACANTHAVALNEAQRPDACRRLLADRLWWEPGTRQPTEACMASDTSSISFAVFVGLVMLMDATVYAVMTSCCHAIYRQLNADSEKYSAKTAKLQRQMNWILLVQMIIPLFTSIVPVGILVAFPLLKVDLPGAGLLVTMAFAWVPVISPVTTICLVSSFRRRLARAVGVAFVRPCCGERLANRLAAGSSGGGGVNSITPFRTNN